ncbi:hypothetical protein ACSNN7_01755 [Micromonospora sp. URMC 105]
MATLVAAQVFTASAGTVTMAGPDPSAPGPHAVRTVAYTLGDTAFQVPGFHAGDGSRLADIELAGAVHYPADVGHGGHPLVLLSHGLWETCADRRAGAAWESAFRRLYGPDPLSDPAERERLEAVLDKNGAALNRWPCAAGVPALPSYRGYDYLAQRLASHGFVVVSISANGINVGEGGEPQDMARATLINKHLQLWQQLATRGRGPLAGRFVDGRGRPAQVDFAGHVDLTNVGTLGHSRGGRGVMWQAADAHRNQWPSGVQVKAVVPLEPAGYYTPDDRPRPEYQVTKIPFVAVGGACDLAVGLHGPSQYVTDVHGANTAPVHQITVRGANHNFFNTQWSPRSGQVMAHDEVHEHRILAPGEQLPPPGRCVAVDTDTEERQLDEDDQRRVALTYVTAFFLRYLDGRTDLDPTLTGREHPLADVADVRVTVTRPVRR